MLILLINLIAPGKWKKLSLNITLRLVLKQIKKYNYKLIFPNEQHYTLLLQQQFILTIASMNTTSCFARPIANRILQQTDFSLNRASIYTTFSTWFPPMNGHEGRELYYFLYTYGLGWLVNDLCPNFQRPYTASKKKICNIKTVRFQH